MKACSTCKIEKPLSLFYVRRDGGNERPSSSCKACVVQRTKQRKKLLLGASADRFYDTGKPCRRGHRAMRIAANGECQECYRLKDRQRSTTRNGTEERKKYFATWAKVNAQRVSRIKSKYATSEKGRVGIRANFARRYASDPDFKARCALRNALKRVIRATGEQKSRRTQEILGYGPEQLRARIECQFRGGMTWANYGEWEIDHKKPVARFVAQGVTEPRVINALCNLQPLWREQNRSKGARYAS